jgi:hypothetical protein
MKTLSFVVVMPLCLAFPAHAANVYTGCAVPPSTLMCCSSQARRRWAQEPRRARRPSTSSASPARLPTLRGLMRIRCERKLSGAYGRTAKDSEPVFRKKRADSKTYGAIGDRANRRWLQLRDIGRARSDWEQAHLDSEDIGRLRAIERNLALSSGD